LIKDDIMAFQSGKRDAFASVLSEYEPLIESQISGLYGNVFSESDNDDLRQEATIALYSAACSYDTDQDKITFGLYAKICIRNRLISYLKKHSYRDVLENEDVSDESDPEQVYIDKEDYHKLTEFIDEQLTVYEKNVFNLYLMNKSYAEISEKLGKNIKSVDNAICRIKQKLGKRPL